MANKSASRTKRSSGRSGGKTSRKKSTGGEAALSSPVDKAREFFEPGNRDYKEIFMELISNPAVKYVAGGLATAVLTRIANNMADRYPEISTFIKENIDTFGGKISEFRQDLTGESAPH